MYAKLMGRVGYEVSSAEYHEVRGAWIIAELGENPDVRAGRLVETGRYKSFASYLANEILDDICNTTGDCPDYSGNERRAYAAAKERIGDSWPVEPDYWDNCPRRRELAAVAV